MGSRKVDGQWGQGTLTKGCWGEEKLMAAMHVGYRDFLGDCS